MSSGLTLLPWSGQCSSAGSAAGATRARAADPAGSFPALGPDPIARSSEGTRGWSVSLKGQAMSRLDRTLTALLCFALFSRSDTAISHVALVHSAQLRLVLRAAAKGRLDARLLRAFDPPSHRRSRRTRLTSSTTLQDDIEKVPTSVHVELLKLGKIADPFKGMDEWACQCACSAHRASLSLGAAC